MIFEIATAMFSEYIDAALHFATDLLGSKTEGEEKKPSGRPFRSLQPLGLVARPRDPDLDANGENPDGCDLMFGFDGHDAWAMPCTDPRALLKMPPQKKGGTCLYSSGIPNAVINLDGENGALLILVPYDDEASKNYAFSIDPAGKSIQCRHAVGMGWSITEGGKNSTVINNRDGDAYLEVNDDGLVLNGNTKAIGSLVISDSTPSDVAFAEPVPLSRNLDIFATQVIAAISALKSAVGGPAAGVVVPIVKPTTTSKLSASP